MSRPDLVYLLKKFPRLSETFILNEILAQEALGRSITVLSRRSADDEPRHPQFSRLRAEIELLPPLRALDGWTTLFPDGGRDEDVLERAATAVRRDQAEWKHPRFASLLSEALYVLRRTRTMSTGHIHTHFATDSAVVAMLVQDLGGPSYSMTVHAKDIYRRTISDALYDRLYTQARFAVTVCDANVTHLNGVLSLDGAARVRRLYNGIDRSIFDDGDHAEPRDENHILSVGRLVAKKGFDVLVDAIAVLRDQGRPVVLTLVGDGEERQQLQARVERAGLNDCVRMTGALDQGAVRDLMRRASLFCLPCLVGGDGNRDALPTVLLESMAAGLPVISTPVTGIPEIVDNGRAGVLVAEHDVAGTAQAMARLLDDSGERRRLADAGRERAAECFDIDIVSQTLASWFDEASAMPVVKG